MRPWLTLAIAALAASAVSVAAHAGSSWDEIRPLVFGERAIQTGAGMMTLTAPSRPENQAAVPIELDTALSDGRTIKAVTLIVDENPVPVAAEFEIGGARASLSLSTNLRLNSETDVHAVVETSDGQLYMAARHVKFAGGQAACSAPAMGDEETIAENMGRMEFQQDKPAVAMSQLQPTARLKISHPNHTGMVLDQITLLYVPYRVIDDVEVRQGDELVFTMRGSMSMSQDPEIRFDYRRNGAASLAVTAKDTDETVWRQSFPIGPES